MADRLLRCDHVSRTFGSGPDAVVAVHGTSLTVHDRSAIAIQGPSGSGKSTLLHLMAGLEQPTSGTISWPALGQDPSQRRQAIGVVFQSPSLIPSLDVAENVALPLLLAGVDPDASAARASEAMVAVGVEQLAERLPEELSGGQAQRVAVARVVAQQPRLILADEPTGQLDHTTGDRVMDVLAAAADHLQAALVVSTHDDAVAQRLPTRWTMQDGRLLGAEGV